MWPLYADIDDAYDTFAGNLSSTPYEDSVFLIQRGQSAYLGALRLALSTQFVDAYPLLRSTLEYGVYALYFRDHKDKFLLWSQRHHGPKERKAARKLHISKMLEYLEGKDAELGKKVKWLYDSTIDLGAHPNPAAVGSAYKSHELDDGGYHEIRFLGGEGFGWRLSLQQAALVGVSAIQIASTVFPERASILGIPQKIDAIHDQMRGMFQPSNFEDLPM